MTEYAPYAYPQNPPGQMFYAPPRSARVPALTATVALVITMVVAVVTLVAAIWMQSNIDVDTMSYTEIDQYTDSVLAVSVIVVLLTAAAILFAATSFIIWLYRVRANVEAFGAAMQWAKGWTIGGWFIPLANLVIPLRVISEIDSDSEACNRGVRSRIPRAIFVWWAILWISFLVLDRVISSTSLTDPGAVAGIPVAILTTAVELGAAICAILLIRRITDNQDAHLSFLQSSPAPQHHPGQPGPFGRPGYPAQPGYPGQPRPAYPAQPAYPGYSAPLPAYAGPSSDPWAQPASPAQPRFTEPSTGFPDPTAAPQTPSPWSPPADGPPPGQG